MYRMKSAGKILNYIIPVSYWHEFLDLVFMNKLVHKLVLIDDAVHPMISVMRSTRSSPDETIIFRVPFAITVTFQTSYFIKIMEHFKQRSIRKPDISLSHFKSELYLYYWSALLQVYKVDDPRTCMEVGRFEM
jgi:hypothetical protein